jgi:hypothetical protein
MMAMIIDIWAGQANRALADEVQMRLAVRGQTCRVRSYADLKDGQYPDIADKSLRQPQLIICLEPDKKEDSALEPILQWARLKKIPARGLWSASFKSRSVLQLSRDFLEVQVGRLGWSDEDIERLLAGIPEEPAPSSASDADEALVGDSGPVGMLDLTIFGLGGAGSGGAPGGNGGRELKLPTAHRKMLLQTYHSLGILRGFQGQEADQDRGQEPVKCSVFSPPKVAISKQFMVQVFTHSLSDEKSVAAEARTMDSEARPRGSRSLQTDVKPGTQLTFDLVIPELQISNPVQSMVWTGIPEAVQFGVKVPAGMEPGTVFGTVTVSHGGVPRGTIGFTVVLVPAEEMAREEKATLAGAKVRHYSRAFISYASEDRAKVLEYTRVLKAANIGYFQDIMDLEPGQIWEEELYRSINHCDLFLLFWSSAAKISSWVRREVDYALSCQEEAGNKGPDIRPVLIEGPPVPEPWDHLRHLHFNDKSLYF